MKSETFACHRPPILSSKSECILSRRHTFCQGGGSLICQDAHLFCQGSRCSRENKSDKPILRDSAKSKKTVSFRSCEPGGCRLCFCNEKCYNGNKHISYYFLTYLLKLERRNGIIKKGEKNAKQIHDYARKCQRNKGI